MSKFLGNELVVIQKTIHQEFLRLNDGIPYTAILFDVLTVGNVVGRVVDSKSMIELNNACLALFNEYKHDFLTLKAKFDEMTTILESVITFSSVIKGKNTILFRIEVHNHSIDSSSHSPQKVISPQINQTYIISESDPNNHEFYVPDYFVQAQNGDKLSYDTFAYLPNFELCFHKVDKIDDSCDDSCEKSYDCNCDKHKRRKRKKHHKKD
ncbi:unnamed protein product, partial [marine sediment metagenome]